MSTRDINCYLGENVTGIGYQLFDASGLIGARVTSGISNPSPGVYLSTGVTTTGALGVHWSNTAGTIVADEVFDVNPVTAGTVSDKTGYTLASLPTAPTDWLTAAAVKADAVAKLQAGLSTYAGGDTAGTTVLLARIPAAVMLASSYTAPPTAAAIATAVETAIINDTDSTAVLAAITDKIASVNPSLAGLTLSAIASSVWSNGTRALTDKAGFTISGTSQTLDALAAALATAHGSGSWSTLTAENLRAAVGLASADLDDQLASLAGGVSPDAIATAVVDISLSGHTAEGTLGGYIVAAGNSGDPWAGINTGQYTGNQFGALLQKLNIPTASGYLRPIPALGSPDTCTVFGYAVNMLDQVVAGARIILTPETLADAVRTPSGGILAVRTLVLVSDETGLFSAALPKGIPWRIHCADMRINQLTFTATEDELDVGDLLPSADD